jgi:hypothetical protein
MRAATRESTISRGKSMSFVRDLRVAAHSLIRTPGLAMAVVLTLSLGSLELQAQLKRDHAWRAITAQTDAE